VRRIHGVVLVLAGAAALAGCSSNSDTQASPPDQASGSGSAPATSAPATSTPRTVTPRPPSRPVQSTPPAPVDGSCPYVSSDAVQDIVGQHITRTTVTPTTPHPGCSFYRPNGERAADIQVSALATPVAAQTRAIQIGGKGANGITGRGLGDGGVVTITGTGALLAVSKGRALVVVRINQRISLEARELATYVVARV
jgi:Domain of unknown function (DUF2020)/Protein of unknown function (DUF3558)